MTAKGQKEREGDQQGTVLDGVSYESEDYRPRLSERKILQQQLRCSKIHVFVNVTVKSIVHV